MPRQLLDNVYRMSNTELIGLAKNRFVPCDLQLAVAKTDYRRAHLYLCENTGLSIKTRDYLWSDECNSGYSLKATMLACGQYSENPEKYVEFYDRYEQTMWSRSPWRMGHALFGHYYYRTENTTGTPTKLLHRVYDQRLKPELEKCTLHGYYPQYYLERLARHPNVDLNLAIKLSQSGVDKVQRIGFERIVELSK